MKLALAIICKGTDEEAQLLDRCLDNLSPYVDGIFITRTQPNTAVGNVAIQYNAILSEFEWCDDFAAARNFNFAQVPKDYDWILWTDVDDMWRDANKLRPLLEKHKHVDAFGFWYLYEWDEFKKPTVVHRKTMIVKNDGSTKWEGAIHEDLMPSRQLDTYLVEGIERLHLTNDTRAKQNAQRNLRIAKKEVLKKQDDPRSYWNLANAQFAVSEFIQAKESFEEFIETSSSTEEIYIARTRLANAFKALNKREDSIRELQTAIGLEPTLPDAYFQLAAYLFEFGQLDKAEHYCIQGLLRKPQIMKMVVYNPRDYDYNPMMLLARIYENKNRPDLMLPLLKGCLKIYPKDKMLQKAVKEGENSKKLLGKALEAGKRLQKIKDRDKLRAELDKLPIEIRSYPLICALRNENFIKTESSGKDLVIYCGNTMHTWNPELFKTKGVGGSEETVIHLAEEWAKMGWHVTVYNNCGHKEVVSEGVTYKPFWEWNYRDKQDVVILWRWAKPLDAEINAPKIFLDLHDVIPEGELTEKRLHKLTKIFVKSQFHRSLFPNVLDSKFAIVPNGLEIYKDTSIKKDKYLMINTSSPDRSMDVLPGLFLEVKKQVPKARFQWAYGWEGFVNTYANDSKKMMWMEETKQAMEEAGIESLGRITQEEVGKLYQKASILAYPTEFAEIDCISVKKAQAAGCYPVATDFGALNESIQWGSKIHSSKTKDKWNRPYQFHFGLEGEKEQQEWVEACVKAFTQKHSKNPCMCGLTWSKIAANWNKEFIT